MNSRQASDKRSLKLERALSNAVGSLEELQIIVSGLEPAVSLSGKEQGPDTHILEALTSIRRLASQYQLTELSKAPLGELEAKLKIRPRWYGSLVLVVEAYDKLVGDRKNRRPFVSKAKLVMTHRTISQRAKIEKLQVLSSSEILALLAREGFMEKSGAHIHAKYRPIPHVKRLMKKLRK